VLVAGGGNGGPDATAELYDPATQTFTPTAGNMTEARSAHTAALLTNKAIANYGKVLIVGSADSTAELYDPVSSTFSATGSMHHARTGPTATLLSSGKVLIVGGNTNSGDLVAELYDPASGSFSDTGSATTLRGGHTATPLLNGQVLIAGGGTATAELYEPATGTFSANAGDMTEARTGHTATLLGAADGVQNGSVLKYGAGCRGRLVQGVLLLLALPRPAGHRSCLQLQCCAVRSGERWFHGHWVAQHSPRQSYGNGASLPSPSWQSLHRAPNRPVVCGAVQIGVAQLLCPTPPSQRKAPERRPRDISLSGHCASRVGKRAPFARFSWRRSDLSLCVTVDRCYVLSSVENGP
jgi:hypothetical protein